MKTGLGVFLTLLALAFAVACEAAQSAPGFIPVTDSMWEKPAPGDWLMWRRTLDG